MNFLYFTIRTCELEAIGRSCKGSSLSFWEVLHRKLQNETFLETLIIKQLVIDNDNAEIIASCVTNVRNVLIESIDMNKKQWVKFAVELNRSDKKIQSLGKYHS